MKKKIIKIMSLALASVAMFSVIMQPVLATNDSVESSEVSPSSEQQPQLEPSILVIEAYNTDEKKYLSSMSFEITEKSTGNVVSFSKTDSGEYEYDITGRYKYVETYDGYVEIKGLNGSYDIKNILADGDIKCDTDNTSLSISTEERKTVRFEYSANHGTIKVEFHSEDDSAISNAKFTIKDDSGKTLGFIDNGGIYEYSFDSSMTEISTNSSGSAILNLPGGRYTITQTSAPVEYNGEYVTKTVSISNQEEITVKMINTKEYGDLIISVSDSIDENNGLTGAEFSITDANGNNVYVSKNTEGSYSFSFTSGETLMTSSSGNIALSGIPEGSYIITQRNSAVGFESAGTKEFEVRANNTTSIKILNDRSVGNLTIKITDEETGNPVEGFIYNILNKEGETPISFKQTSNGYEYSENGNKDVETDENGEIILEKIPIGNYYISQLSAANGYLLDINDIEQAVQAGQTSEYNTIATKSNSLIMVLNTDGDPVKNVEFIVSDTDGNVVIEDKTDEDGKYMISGVKEGSYVLEIKKSPETYAKYKKNVKFSLDDSGKADGLGRITLDYTKASLNLGKKGVAVVLTNKDDNSALTINTDENGIATFSQLVYGEYGITLEDTSILFSEIKFTVDEEFTEVSYNVDLSANADASSNNESEVGSDSEQQTETPVVNKKLNSNAIMVVIAAIIAITGGIYGYFVYKKKKGEETALLADDSIKVGYDDDGNAILYEEIEVEMENTSEDNDSVEENTGELNKEANINDDLEISDLSVKDDEEVINLQEGENDDIYEDTDAETEVSKLTGEESEEPKVVSDSEN